VRLIYLDESGISASESVAVVAGIIVNDDRQWKIVEKRIHELIRDYAPGEPGPNFAFHATDIFSGRKLYKRPAYPLEKAIELLKALVSIPREFELPIAVSALQKSFEDRETPAARRTSEGVIHGMAFSLCALMAERYIRERVEPSELGRMVAENNTTTRDHLKQMHEMLRGQFRTTNKRDVFDLFAGATENSLPLTRIISSVLFAEKGDEPMLQLADAVAFFIHRFYEGRTDVDQFMTAMIGGPTRPAAFGDAGGISTILAKEYAGFRME
jgi:hypothetical protein